MKFLHISDLHLGKRFKEYSLIEDQQYILDKIIEIADSVKPDGVLIAGDVYDKSIPAAEAVRLFDGFLCRLAERKVSVFIISGNHDSSDRLAFGGALMNKSGVYISPVYNGEIKPITLTDEYGKVNVYLMPFLKPVHVRQYHTPEEGGYTAALSAVIGGMNIDTSERNLLVAHQFVTGASRTESEEITVGELDNVDASIFFDFDYTALGHIHSAQKCVKDTVRYCGTPLKYSFSEANDEKSVTVIELFEKGRVDISTIPLKPLRDMKIIRGSYNELMNKSFYDGTSYRDDYMKVILTDEEDVVDAIGRLRTVYRNIMNISYDNKRTSSSSYIEGGADVENKTPLELFSDFYEQQNNQPMSEEQTAFVKRLIEEIWEGEK